MAIHYWFLTLFFPTKICLDSLNPLMILYSLDDEIPKLAAIGRLLHVHLELFTYAVFYIDFKHFKAMNILENENDISPFQHYLFYFQLNINV